MDDATSSYPPRHINSDESWQDQYSRIIWELGYHETKKLHNSAALVVGLGPVGAEVGSPFGLIRLRLSMRSHIIRFWFD